MRFKRHTWLLVAAAAVLAVLGVAWLIGAIAHWRFERHWAQVKPGMSKAEVQALLGTPADDYPAGAPQSGSILGNILGDMILDSFSEKWAYGRRRLIAFQPQFPFVGLAFDGLLMPEDEDYVVYFSAQGKVLKKAHPYHVRAAK